MVVFTLQNIHNFVLKMLRNWSQVRVSTGHFKLEFKQLRHRRKHQTDFRVDNNLKLRHALHIFINALIFLQLLSIFAVKSAGTFQGAFSVLYAKGIYVITVHISADWSRWEVTKSCWKLLSFSVVSLLLFRSHLVALKRWILCGGLFWARTTEQRAARSWTLIPN